MLGLTTMLSYEMPHLENPERRSPLLLLAEDFTKHHVQIIERARAIPP